MYAKIFLIEDDAAIAAVYQRRLQVTGFTNIEHFATTENIEQALIQGYEGPSIILSDYFVKPQSPAIYVPKLRAAGMEAPLVIASGAVEMESLNGFAAQGWLNGFFSKGDELNAMMARICQHLIDLSELAQIRYEEWVLLRRFTRFLDDYTRTEASLMRELLLLQEPKEAAAKHDIPQRKVYDLQKAMHAALLPMEGMRPLHMLERALARRIAL